MKTLRIITSVMLIVAAVFTVTVGGRLIGTERKPETIADQKCILTLWQLDVFEGGSGSRRKFLSDVSKSFEKRNQGIYVMVLNYDVDGAEENMKKGVFPDMISFGTGVTVSGFKEIKTENEVFPCGGEINGKICAVPWCRGNYVLIRNPKLTTDFTENIEKLLVSRSEYNLPLTALALSGYTANEITVMEPLDAYVKFVSEKTPYFLGTQRDVVRLTARGFEFEMTQINEFNDLYQYISVTSTSEEKLYYSEKFINYLLKEEIQNRLSEINMLSAQYRTDFDYPLSVMRGESYKQTVSAFIDKGSIEKLNDLSYSMLKGEPSAQIKIKNMLFRP